jgi:hypothetical protein
VKLIDWEVWWTYVTALESPLGSFSAAIPKLLHSGLTEAILKDDGTAYWKLGNEISESNLRPRFDAVTSTARFGLPPPSSISDFGREGLVQAASFLVAEDTLFGRDLRPDLPHLRFLIGACLLKNKEHEWHVFPTVKLYSSGVVLVEMRILSGKEPTEVKDFIRSYVRGYFQRFPTILVPPVVATLAPPSTAHKGPTWDVVTRFKAWRTFRLHQRAIQEATTTKQWGDFAYSLAPLTQYVDSGGETITDLARTVQSVVAHILTQPRRMLRNAVTPKFTFADYWAARIHTHLFKHENQQVTPSENERANGWAFGSILAGMYPHARHLGRKQLPKNLRQLDDYGLYLGLSGSLWVWSASEYSSSNDKERITRDYPTYENMTKIELLEYAHMIKRRSLNLAAAHGSQEDVLRARREVIEVGFRFAETARWGEIRELLSYGQQVYGEQVRDRVLTDTLSYRLTERNLAETRRVNRMLVTLTFVFGLISALELAEQVISPAWQLSGLWHPSESRIEVLFYNLVAIVTMVSILTSIYLIIRRRS